MEPVVEELNEAEVAWVAELHRELAERGVDPLDVDALGGYLDSAYAQWSTADPATREEAARIVNRVGAGLGALLLSRLPLRWALVTDDYGTDLALHRERGDILLTPMTMVGKRWSTGETGYLPGLVEFTVSRVGSLVEAHP